MVMELGRTPNGIWRQLLKLEIVDPNRRRERPQALSDPRDNDSTGTQGKAAASGAAG